MAPKARPAASSSKVRRSMDDSFAWLGVVEVGERREPDLASRYFIVLGGAAGFGTGATSFGSLPEGVIAYSWRTRTSLAWELLLVLSRAAARSYSAPARRL